jgi:hypothetical protein
MVSFRLGLSDVEAFLSEMNEAVNQYFSFFSNFSEFSGCFSAIGEA